MVGQPTGTVEQLSRRRSGGSLTLATVKSLIHRGHLRAKASEAAILAE